MVYKGYPQDLYRKLVNTYTYTYTYIVSVGVILIRELIIYIIMNERRSDIMNEKQRLLKEIPREILIKIKNQPMNMEELSLHCWNEYYFEIEFDEDSDHYGDVFYNADLRSWMGSISGDCEVLRLVPEHYAKGWEDTYWKKLIEDNEILEVIWK